MFKLLAVWGLFATALSLTDDLDLGINDEAGYERQLREQGFSDDDISIFLQVNFLVFQIASS